MSDPDDAIEEVPGLTTSYVPPPTPQRRAYEISNAREGSFAGKREAQVQDLRAGDVAGLWDPPSIRKADDPRAPPKTRGVLEENPVLDSAMEQPPPRRPNQSKASYERDLERWWQQRMSRASSDMETFRQRADALRAKVTKKEPAQRGPPISERELDFLKADSDNPNLLALKQAVKELNKETKELDLPNDAKLKRADEFRTELKKLKRGDKKGERPDADWRLTVHRFTTFYFLPFVPPLYYVLQLNKSMNWKPWQILPFMVLPLPFWAQASLAKSRLQPWSKSDGNIPVELFLSSAAGWLPLLVVTYTERRRKVLALFSSMVGAMCVGLFTPLISPTPLHEQVKSNVQRTTEHLQPGRPIYPVNRP